MANNATNFNKAMCLHLCPKLGPGFQRHMSWSFFIEFDILEMITRFVDIDRIVGHHCLNCILIITSHLS